MFALSLAEGLSVKLAILEGLAVGIEQRLKENTLRDQIAAHPWLIGPKWETFRRETSLGSLIADAATKAGWDAKVDAMRIDLILSSGNQGLLIEFLRPGKKIDWDHLSRFRRYMQTVRAAIEANTGIALRQLEGMLVADELSADTAVQQELKEMKSAGMFAMDWDMLLAQSRKRWDEVLSLVSERANQDPRIADVVAGLKGGFSATAIAPASAPLPSLDATAPTKTD